MHYNWPTAWQGRGSTGLRYFLNMDRPQHHSTACLKERGVEKRTGWNSTIWGRLAGARWCFTPSQSVWSPTGDLLSRTIFIQPDRHRQFQHLWRLLRETGQSVYGLFQVLQCCLEQQLKTGTGISIDFKDSDTDRGERKGELSRADRKIKCLTEHEVHLSVGSLFPNTKLNINCWHYINL